MPRKPLRDMIVLLPGITGSVLQKDGKDLWAISGQSVQRWLRSLGASLQTLRLDGDDPGGIVATRIMPDAHVIPGLVRIDGYSATSRMIIDNFNVVPGSISESHPANFIEFPYDWRLDNRIIAARLAELVDSRLVGGARKFHHEMETHPAPPTKPPTLRAWGPHAAEG